jgi:uncharacterized membrane protein YdfJ with MMPL/SSD domain
MRTVRVVLAVLVPATTHMLGDNHWRMPHCLKRRLPHLDVEGDLIEPRVTGDSAVPA